jgi:hypothetical protein
LATKLFNVIGKVVKAENGLDTKFFLAQASVTSTDKAPLTAAAITGTLNLGLARVELVNDPPKLLVHL